MKLIKVEKSISESTVVSFGKASKADWQIVYDENTVSEIKHIKSNTHYHYEDKNIPQAIREYMKEMVWFILALGGLKIKREMV